MHVLMVEARSHGLIDERGVEEEMDAEKANPLSGPAAILLKWVH